MIKECKKHGETEHFKRTESNGYRCKECHKEYYKNKSKDIINKRKLKMSELIKYKGGKCNHCNYNKCEEALEFHHIEPDKKSFVISRKIHLSTEKLKEEADKCVLLCVNCHREIHDNILKFTIEEEKITFEYIEEN